IHQHHFLWWTRYNYMRSTVLNSGITTPTMLIFFILLYLKNGRIGFDTLVWWDNM
ncbi:hypothetical protein BD779DRAFT_1454776, partial [Infundibulicybe gibba]